MSARADLIAEIEATLKTLDDLLEQAALIFGEDQVDAGLFGSAASVDGQETEASQ